MTSDPLAEVRDKKPLRKPGASVELTPEEGFLLSQADGHLTVAELQHVVPFPPADLARLLLGLLAKGALEWVSGTSQGPRAAKRPQTAPAEPSPAGPAASPAQAGPATGDEEDPEVVRLRRRVRIVRRLIEQGDPFELFGVKPGAEDAEVREAFQRMTRQYHPDRFYALKLDAELRREIDDIYAEIQNMYSFVGTREARRAWQRKTAPQAPVADKADRGADAERLVELADEAIERRQYPSAITNLKLADRMDPTGGWGQRAKLVELLEKVDRKVEMFTAGGETPHDLEVSQLTETIGKIRGILPPVPRLLRDITTFLYLHSADFPLARDMAQALLREHRSVDNLLLSARIHLKCGLQQTALDLLEEVRATVPDHPDLKTLLREAKRRS